MLSGANRRSDQTHDPSISFGASIQEDGSVLFRIFAPAASSIRLKLEGASDLLPLTACGDGWHTLATAQAKAGTLYKFVLPDGSEVPDPASRYQPRDVHGPSEVIDPDAYRWMDGVWRGRPWEQAVLYELHVGTFTPEGTFRSATLKLDHLADLGITAIELMCLSDFAGNRNWGYDGVLMYAPDSAYGRPEDLKAFVDGAHARGIMVILDVVYNHFGPEGDFMPSYFPDIFTHRHSTPWGDALNFDGPRSCVVRELIIQNAIYWIREFHLDGLRIDASHAMIDESPRHILEELRDRVVEAAGDRTVHLILENESNIASRLTRDASGRPNEYTAQWNHDITHLLAAILGPSSEERRKDDKGETQKLGYALAKGFVIAAEEQGKAACLPPVPPTAFVAFIQTHDLIGNRIFGERIFADASPESIRAIVSIYLLLPQIPMIFMGEEWAASTPFPYFCDYHGDLAEAVRKGRCDQLSKLDPAPSPEEMKRAPDPQADQTLRSAQLRWEELHEGSHADWLAWYKRLLQIRRQSVVPLLPNLTGACGEFEVLGPGVLKVCWTLAGGARLHLAANLSDTAAKDFGPAPGRVIWAQGTDENGALGPWSVRWSVEGNLPPREEKMRYGYKVFRREQWPSGH